MTAHASKGLGFDDVIVVNGKNETYGFPSKVEDDPVLGFVVKGDRSIDYAEERRLFYVAMTRTKNRVYFIAPEKNPSEFLLELKRDYKNVDLRGKWNEEVPKAAGRKYCPLCGYPLQYRYKNSYGLRLYLCTNEPELCSFMTNEYRAGKMSIMKCGSCRDGYLIVKPGQGDGYFLGCTNYKQDHTGCNNSISRKRFYEMMGYAWEPGPGAAETDRKKPDEQRNTKADQDQKKQNPETAPGFVRTKYREEKAEILKPNLEPVIYKGQDLNDVVYIILTGLRHISEVRYYGVTMLPDVLRGCGTKRIYRAELNLLPEYGALKSISREELQTVFDWLLSNHYMLKTRGEYPVLHPTYDGLHYGETMTKRQLEKLKKYLEEEVILWNL